MGQLFFHVDSIYENFKTLACMIHKKWHASKSVMDGQMNRQPKSNMPLQLLQSVGGIMSLNFPTEVSGQTV